MQNRELNTCKHDIYSFLHVRLPTNTEPYEIRAEKTDGSRAPYVCTAPPTTDYDEFKNIKYDFDLVSK